MFNFLNKYKKGLVYFPLVVYWIILLTLTSVPGEELPQLDFSDKWEHFLAFFGLAVLLSNALRVQIKYPLFKKNPSLYTLLFCAGYALFDELHQLFIPGRSCDPLDFTADVTGAIIGILLSILIFFISNIISRTQTSNN